MRKTIALVAAFIALSASGAEHKNVKILTGLDEITFRHAMNVMRAALGTHCDYCHVVTKEKGWQWASDEKPAKNRARDMIRMVMDINRTTFGGRAVVSCDTCHRGSIKPSALMALPVMTPKFPTPALAKPDLPEARELIAKYAAAVGDVTRWRSRVARGVRTAEPASGELASDVEVTVSGGKTRLRIALPKEPSDRYLDGTAAWSRENGESKPLSGWENLHFLDVVAAFEPVPPSQINESARTIARESIAGADVWVVEQQRNERERERFYLDAKTGLLVRRAVLVETPVGTIPRETDFEDWRDAGGVKYPFKISTRAVDPWSAETHQYTSVTLGATVDDALFQPPK